MEWRGEGEVEQDKEMETPRNMRMISHVAQKLTKRWFRAMGLIFGIFCGFSLSLMLDLTLSFTCVWGDRS